MNNKKTTELENLLKHASHDDLEKHIKQIQDFSFTDFFDSLLIKYDASKGVVINHTNIDRTYAYQILQGKKLGSKDKIFQLALGLQCSLYECNTLLQLSKNPKLYAKKKRDSILIYSLESNLSILQTNELLLDYDEDILQ